MTTPAANDVFDGWDCAGWVDIDGFSLFTVAWAVQPDSVRELWTLGTVRGGDVQVPNFPGSVPFPRRPTATELTLRMAIRGDRAPGGGTYANPLVGLEANTVEIWNACVVQPFNTRVLSLHMPSGSVRSTDIHSFNFTPGEQVGGLFKYTLQVSVPSGLLV